MSYEYFSASLPALAPEAPPTMTLEAFRDACRQHLSPAHARTVCALLDKTPDPHPFAVAWRDCETQLRNAVARRRAARLGREAAPFLHPHAGYRVRIETAVETAFQQPDPLRREQILDALRWELVEVLEGPAVGYGPKTVFAYALKLVLASRRARRDRDRGRERAQSLVHANAGTKDGNGPA